MREAAFRSREELLEMDETPNRSLVFLPWAEYKAPVTFGKITIYPFNDLLLKNKMVSEPFFRLQQTNFQPYKKNLLGPIPNVPGTLESQKKTIGLLPSPVSVVGFRDMLPDFYAHEQVLYPVDEILDTITLLSLLCTWKLPIIKDEIYFNSFQPLNWEPRILSYTPSSDSDPGIAQVTCGGYLTVNSIGPPHLSVVTRPEVSRWASMDDHIHAQDADFRNYANQTLLNYETVSKEDWFQRMIRAIRVCNRSLTNAEFQDKYEMIGEMILLLVSALNTLYPDVWRKDDFAKTISDHLNGGHTSCDGGTKEVRVFLGHLYDLRSKYSHGESPKTFRRRVDECTKCYGHDPYALGRFIFGLCCKAHLRERDLSISYGDCFDRFVRLGQSAKSTNGGTD